MRTSSLLRNIDRYIGIPLVYILGKLKKRNSLPAQIEKIGLLNTAAIGDTILLSGPTADLRARFPSAEITFFSGSSNYEAAMLIPGVQVVKLPVTSFFQSASLLSAQSFDLWIDFGQWARVNALYSYFVDAKFKIGFNTTGQYRHYVYDQTANHEGIHEIDNYRKLLRAIGIQANAMPQLSLPHISTDLSSKVIVLHMNPGGSKAFLKKWPEERWIQLIDRLVEIGYRIQLTGCGDDLAGCERVKAVCFSTDEVEVLAGRASLRETALILQKALCVVSIDTGIMHLAAALGCPTIALHGPTSPLRWGGVGTNVHPVTPNICYSPCIHLGFESRCSANRCMQAIGVDQVLDAISLSFNGALSNAKRPSLEPIAKLSAAAKSPF